MDTNESAAGKSGAVGERHSKLPSHYTAPADAETIRDALNHIPADSRDLWLRMGMAVRSELGDAGHDVWDSWSRTSNRYNERDARDVWRSIKPNGGIGIGTLFAKAKEHGWQGTGRNNHKAVPRARHNGHERPQDAVKAEHSPIPDEALATRPKSHPGLGKPSATWIYRDAHGRPLSFVSRFDPSGERKQVIPQTWDGQSWRWKAPPTPRPIYGLDRLAARPEAPVVVAEGEKACDAAGELMPDHVAVTSPNGCDSAHKADWSPLLGRSVRIWPDHDEDGEKYAKAVTDLTTQAGASSVEILDIDSLNPSRHKWDAVDAQGDGWTAEGVASKARWIRQGGEPETPPRWSVIWLPDAKPHVNDPALIRGLCKPKSMILCYGGSNTGKSFQALDRDLCLAAGRPWYGRETAGGFVLYVAAEGARSIETRVAAYRDIFLSDAGDIPFAILPAAIDLRQANADTRPLIDFVRRIEDERGIKCIKVTVDTLARAMQGGNENASEDMGAVIGHADQIRAEIDCAFEFVHHCGKDAAQGARGWSGLRAATDTEIEVVARDGLHTATVTKQRDYGKEGDAFSFRLRVIELGTDPYGHPVTTCVPEWVDTPDRSDRKLTRAESAVKSAMHEVMTATKRTPPASCWDAARPPKTGQYACPLPDLREHLRRAGGVSDSPKPDTQDRAVRRAIRSLRASGIIEVFDDWAWLTDTPDKAGQNTNCPPVKSGEGGGRTGQHPLGLSGLSGPLDDHDPGRDGDPEEGVEDDIIEVTI
ncbi:Primase C terminal 2 (PriCT-2) [Thioflavicoccus mobilis 8321]|uniref:Primase C terminal 2 (PriCT-2) n=1 Tax=Thioflavicoccus mobilis 8321 TaxID=765912 RepID=L0GXI9_9GAMM|nr:AAA family ATPase [Thioflavicoccus mobilis]AGA90542.1 Primase C terminal 2 (PriCT-2) [Thioflavicoccus mobilis 8321]